MKLVGYILAFYLLALSVIPCCKMDNCSENEIEQNTQQGQQEENCGTCSPFFSCEGCAAAVTVYEPPPLQLKLPSIQEAIYATYIQSILPSVDIDFWQPPKIV